jgi:hypothetical protein
MGAVTPAAGVSSGVQNVYSLGNTYVDTTTAGGDWYLLGYGEYGNMGRLDSSTGTFNAATRTGKATLNSVAFVRGATDIAVTWTTSGGSLPTGGLLSYDHAVSFALPNASTMTLTGAASNPGSGSGCGDFSRCGTNAGQSLVSVNVLKGSAGLPAQMFVRNVTFGVAYGSAYGLVNNPGINNQLDWNPDGQAFSAVYVRHDNNNGYVTPSGTGSGYTPRTMAVWARHPGASMPTCSPTSAVVGARTVLTFTAVGECGWTVPANITSANVLLVAGGGGGGGGGGGAGGVRTLTSQAISGTVTVTVGGGGAGTSTNGASVGSVGQASSFDGTSAAGGGGGGNYTHQGTTGGSGGGGGQDVNHSPKSGTAGQGNAGGVSNCDWYGGGGGGGGAGSAGQNGGPNVGSPLSSCWSSGRSDLNPTIGGAGGDGVTSSISGSAVVYGGGGGGGVNSNAGPASSGGLGGAGGGGNGARCDQCNGTDGTDGRGGGGGGGDAEGRGGAGGDGVVIVSYVTYVAPTTTTSTTTTTTTSTSTTVAAVSTTTVASSATTAAPALDIIVTGPATTAPPVGQSEISRVTTPTFAPGSGSKPAATTSTSTTLPDNAGGTVPPEAPEVAEVGAGEAAVRVGERSETASVERVDNQLVVTAGEMSAVVAGVDSLGRVSTLDGEGNVRLQAGDKIRVSLSGFEPRSPVEAWMLSTPVLLGSSVTSATGTLSATYVVPEGLDEGVHRVAVVARGDGDEPVTFTVGVLVGDWTKESNLALWLLVTPLVLAIVGALVLPATRRRRRSTAA